MKLYRAVAVCMACTLLPGTADAGNEPAGGFRRWALLLGEWRVVEKRYGFDASLIETNAGEASFTAVRRGQWIEERLTIRSARDTSAALHVFALDPRSGALEIARTDTNHDGFSVIRGTMQDGRIELVEKDPAPDSEVTRRISYHRIDDDHFLRRLEFSQDRGATWFVRSEWHYTRR